MLSGSDEKYTHNNNVNVASSDKNQELTENNELTPAISNCSVVHAQVAHIMDNNLEDSLMEKVLGLEPGNYGTNSILLEEYTNVIIEEIVINDTELMPKDNDQHDSCIFVNNLEEYNISALDVVFDDTNGETNQQPDLDIGLCKNYSDEYFNAVQSGQGVPLMLVADEYSELKEMQEDGSVENNELIEVQNKLSDEGAVNDILEKPIAENKKRGLGNEKQTLKNGKEIKGKNLE